MKTSHLTLLTIIIIAGLFAFKPAPEATVYEYKQFSTVESIIPGGLGRSRIITTDTNGSLVEKDLKNFYSMTGINFSNITNNDVIIVEKVNELTKEGWELYAVTTGVQSPNEKGTSGGIFITRFLLRKPVG